MSERSQFRLLAEGRFLPFFLMQFFGAANDNIFKFAFIVLATYSAAEWGGMDPKSAEAVIGGIFILPFVLFSATAGQLADKYDKAALIRFVKNLEIAIMLAIAAGFVFKTVALLLASVFLMGLHSTLFGPVKYAYLPQHLHESELVGGNGIVEMGTFVAILLGTILGGVLIKATFNNRRQSGRVDGHHPGDRWRARGERRRTDRCGSPSRTFGAVPQGCQGFGSLAYASRALIVEGKGK